MSNFYLNEFRAAGRITAKPELRVSPNGDSVTTFTIAIERPAASKLKSASNPVSDFFKVVAWKENAENITSNFDKGDPIYIEGRVQNRSYEKDGVKHYSTEIVCDSWKYIESKEEKEWRLKKKKEMMNENGDYNENSYEKVLWQKTGEHNPCDYAVSSECNTKIEQLPGDEELPF